MVRIAEIESGSIAEELRLEIGTRIVRINGQRVRDGIDFTYLLADPDLTLETVSPSGEELRFETHREGGEALGIIPAPDTVRECANECVFCFIDGNPPDVRQSLWLRDDDFRLSFTHGSYVTLTNLRDEDWDRIFEQRLTPLYVSVHATDPEARLRMLVNPRPPLSSTAPGSKPQPSSDTSNSRCPPLGPGFEAPAATERVTARRTVTDAALACFRVLFNASCAMR